MLVLSRKVSERIRIGADVVIKVVRIGPNAVRLGIQAPADMNIVREELGLPSPVYSPDQADQRPAPTCHHIPSITEHIGAGMWDGELD